MGMKDVVQALPSVEEQPSSASGAPDLDYDSYDSEDGGQYNGGPYIGPDIYDSDASNTNYVDSHELNMYMQDMVEQWEKSGSPGGEMALAGLYRRIEESKGRYKWKPATSEEAEKEGKQLAAYEIEWRAENTATGKAQAAAQKKAHDKITQQRVKRDLKNKGKKKKY